MSMTSHCHLAGFRARIHVKAKNGHVKSKKRNYAAAQLRTGPASRPARLQTARSGVASTDGPADGPGCCAPDAAPGTALPAARR